MDRLRELFTTGICGTSSLSPARLRLSAAVTLMLAVFPGYAQIPIKPSPLTPSPATTAEFFNALAAGTQEALHGLAMLPKHPSPSERNALDALGVRVLSPLHGTAYRVRVRKDADPAALAANPLAPLLHLLDAKNRAEHRLWEMPPKPFNLTVQFHSGINPDTAEELIKRHAPADAPDPQKLSDQVWMVKSYTKEALERLASDDRVLWANLTPSRSDRREIDRTRAAIGADALQKMEETSGRVRGLGGRGVTVGVFDFGIDEGHGDFSRNRVVRNDAGMDAHATQIAGVIAGNGRMSVAHDSCGGDNKRVAHSKRIPYQWRGIAPLARLLDIPQVPPLGQNGVNAQTHLHYVTTHGMVISNHSYGFSLTGLYDNGNALRDYMIRGGLKVGGMPLPGRLQVTSSGNQTDYFSLTKQLKNALVVGNWELKANRLDPDSARGPTHDGRIKPDVVAPGTFLVTTSFCSNHPDFCAPVGPLCSNATGPIQRQSFYEAATGTSISSAAATGALALVLERYRKIYKVDLARNPPPPSTLRAVMIHAARDLQVSSGDPQPSAGPDFTTGWGFIDVKAAARIVARKHLLNDSLEATCSKVEYTFEVKDVGKGPLRVTLAWDDFPGDPALADDAPKLVNDLDLVLTDPNQNRHLPWQLDQRPKYVDPEAKCGTTVTVDREFKPQPRDGAPVAPPAAKLGRDHLNNVEVVDVPVPVPGIWTATVTAFNLPEGPQQFSLVGQRFRRLERR